MIGYASIGSIPCNASTIEPHSYSISRCRVFRDGRSIEVSTGDRRGEKLRPGDEIYLGRACLRFER